MSLCLAIETLTNYNIYIKNDVYIMIISTIITIFIALSIYTYNGAFISKKSDHCPEKPDTSSQKWVLFGLIG